MFWINMRRVVISSVAGNALEYYDMLVYGFFASTIAQNFFPKQDKLAGIASTFAIFFLGYLVRPLGALFFGRMGDNFGRKPALITSIWLMAISTCALGLLPNYAMIGIWAPLLLLFIRSLQGFSLGGEYCGSLIFIMEHAPKAKRGFYVSLGVAGSALGLLLASFVPWLIHYYFSDAAVLQWAWRLPFLLASLGGLIGWLARRRIPETQLFQESIKMPKSYLKLYHEYFNQFGNVVMIVMIKLFASVLFYLIYVYMNTYMSSKLLYSHQQALTIIVISIILLILLEPWMGKLSDKIGRRPLLVFGLIGSVIWVWPYFWLLQQHSMTLALLAQGVMTLFATAYIVIAIVVIVEIVPVHLRFTVVSLAYAVEASLFSGATPFVAALLIKTTNSYISIALYLTTAALISSFAVYKVRETRYVPQVDFDE